MPIFEHLDLKLVDEVDWVDAVQLLAQNMIIHSASVHISQNNEPTAPPAETGSLGFKNQILWVSLENCENLQTPAQEEPHHERWT